MEKSFENRYVRQFFSQEEFFSQEIRKDIIPVLEGINRIGISDPETIDNIIKGRVPSLKFITLYIVGNKVSNKKDFLEEYPGLSSVGNDADVFFESKKFDNRMYYVCLIPPEIMKRKFGESKNQCARILEKYGQKK